MLSIGDIRELRKFSRRLAEDRRIPSTGNARGKENKRASAEGSLHDTAIEHSDPETDFQGTIGQPLLSTPAIAQNDGMSSVFPYSCIPATPNLSNPMYLQIVSAVDATANDTSTTEEEDTFTVQEIMLFHPVYSRIVQCLPMSSLLSLASVSKSFSSIVRNERNRGRRHQTEWIYRQNFIRHVNMSFASKKSVREEDVFAGIIRELYCYPEHVLVFYTPDIFQYDVRVSDHNGRSRNCRPDQLLDKLMRRTSDDDWRVWHFRLFSVIRPMNFDSRTDHSKLSRNELERMPLWHSEDLTMIFLPSMSNVHVRHRALNLNLLLNIPEFSRGRRAGSLLPYMSLIGERYEPKLLILSVKDLPRFEEESAFDFPVVILSTRAFSTDQEEAWMSISGGDVRVFQVILGVTDRRTERDTKIRALRAQLGLTVLENHQCLLLYFTELWPGGTSKETPQGDCMTLRSEFPNVPLFGGRTGKFMGNQYLPILQTFPTQDSRSLRLREYPTVVTIICFGKRA